MSEHAARALAIFESLVNVEDQPGEWHTIDQAQINLFADATGDHQFIHVDPVKSAERSPYQTTIAHGFLTLSLIVHLVKSIPVAEPAAMEGRKMGINYGLDRVRFPAPVKVGSRIRARRVLLSAELVGANAVQLKQKITVEIDGEEKPACVAEWLNRIVYE